MDLLALTLSQPGPVVCPTLTPPPATCAPRRSATLVIDDDIGRAVRERAESDGDELVRQAAERLVLKHEQLLVPTFMVRV